MSKKEQYDYQNEYNKNNYARLSLVIKKEQRPELEKHYKEKGFESLNSYLKALIKKDMDEDII